MGTDMVCHVEIKRDGKWRHEPSLNLFDYRSYSLYGFLANVKNYSKAPVLSKPKGLPEDVSQYVSTEASESSYVCGNFSYSWLTLSEMLNYDYDHQFEDLRDCGRTMEPGQGEWSVLKEFLPETYFKEIEQLKQLPYSPDDIRIVFWFD